ncbi:MAG: dihydroorotate dehydrogenase electron transfer subunit [Nitrososphaeria archaeon]
MVSQKLFDLDANTLRIRNVVKVLRYSTKYAIIFFRDERVLRTEAGQYLMVWVIEDDEIPLSVSHVEDDGLCGVTVKGVGRTTNALCSISEGLKLGIRGPFGRGYKVKGKKPLLVAGGIGVASIRLLAVKMTKLGVFPTLIIGTRSADDNIFHNEFLDLSENGFLRYIPVTDDGSLGEKGLASEKVDKLVRAEEFDQLYGCGPEKMLYALFKIALKKGIQVQLSLERYMKCAVGICGQCSLDDSGLLVCEDGPVFSNKDLLKSNDFGRFVRTASGKKLPI